MQRVQHCQGRAHTHTHTLTTVPISFPQLVTRRERAQLSRCEWFPSVSGCEPSSEEGLGLDPCVSKATPTTQATLSTRLSQWSRYARLFAHSRCPVQVGAKDKGREETKGEGEGRGRCVCVGGWERGAGFCVATRPGSRGEPARGTWQKAPCLKHLPPLIYDKRHAEPPHAGLVWLCAACWAGTWILQLLLDCPGCRPPPRTCQTLLVDARIR